MENDMFENLFLWWWGVVGGLWFAQSISRLTKYNEVTNKDKLMLCSIVLVSFLCSFMIVLGSK